MAQALIVVGKIWLVLGVGFIALNAGAIWYIEGFTKVAEIFSPFNVVNLIAVLVTLAPGFGLMALGERIQRKRGNR